MKKVFRSVLIVVGLISAIFPNLSETKAARRPQSYPLVCRGAASLKIDNGKSLAWYAGFTFTRGTKPAGEGLAPGECSWMVPWVEIHIGHQGRPVGDDGTSVDSGDTKVNERERS